MPYKLVCPHCDGELKVAKAPVIGAAVRCYLCKEVFKAEQVASDSQATPQSRKLQRPPATPSRAATPNPFSQPPSKPVPQNPFAAGQRAAMRPQSGLQRQQPPQQPKQQPAAGPLDSFSSSGFGPSPSGPSPHGQQAAYQQPATDPTPAWVMMVTVGAGGFGVLVLLVIFTLAVTRIASPPKVAQVPPDLSQPAPAAAPSVSAPAAAVTSPSVTPPAEPNSTPNTSPPASFTPPPPAIPPTPTELAAANNIPPANPTDFSPPPSSDNPFAQNTFGSTGNGSETETTPPATAAPIAAETAPTAAGNLAYRWENGQRYPYHFSMKMDFGEARGASHSGMVTYIPSRAGTQNVRKILEGQTAGEGSGTAFVVHSDGILVTCDHVVKGAKRVSISLQGRKYDAKVVARDARHDLAVLKIEARNLPAVPLGDSSGLGLLQKVVAVGFPLSDVLGKSVKATEGTIAGIVNEETSLIQVNANINPGNSGGPLFNMNGEVIGVNSAKLIGNDVSNVGFAVPIDEVKTLLQSKGLATSATAGTVPADSAAMMQRVTPAVAFVEVQLGLDSENFQVLNFSGFSMQDHVIGQRGTHCNGEMLTSNKGEIIAEKGDAMLPALIGNFSSMVVDKLPDEGETTWETSRVYTVTVETRSNPSYYDPRRGLPGYPRQVEISMIPIVEKVTYQLGQRNGKLLSILKRHELVAIQKGNNEKLFASIGEGSVQFDVERGIPLACEMNYIHVRSEASSEIRVPVKFEYNLGEQESETDFQARLAAKQQAEELEKSRDKSPDVRALLGKLENPPSNTSRYLLLSELSRMDLIPGVRDEVAQAVEKYVLVRDSSERSAALKCLETWGTEANVPALMKLVDSVDESSVRNAIEALGSISKSPEVAAKLVEFVGDKSLYYTAVKALKTMGQPAEEPVIKAMEADDEEIRKRGLDILGDVGGPKSLAILQKYAQNRSNSSIRHAAESALRKYRERRNQKD